YHEGKKFKTSTLPVSPDIFRQASWRRAIYQLPEQYIAWLSYCDFRLGIPYEPDGLTAYRPAAVYR
ncbi:hypothetical protein DSB75_25050, partial [Salmonella enterica subsp. enterica serovar Typhimurium]